MKGTRLRGKVAPVKKVVLEDDPDSDSESEEEEEVQTVKKKKKKKIELPYRKVPPMKPVVEVPPVPYQYLPQEERKKSPPNYRHEAPIEQEVDIDSVLSKLLKSSTDVSLEELMALSPKLRTAYKELITKKRVATQLHSLEDPEGGSEKTETTEVVEVNLTTLKDCQLEQRGLQGNVVGPGQAWVAQDPVTQYLETLPVEERRN
jgi:hypothetical protein